MLPGDFTVSEGHGHPLVYVNIIVGDSLDVQCPWIHKSKIHGQENSMNSFRK
jgi:hypothetical protein